MREADKTKLQALIDKELAKSDGPPTVVEVCDACDSNYVLASALIYQRTEQTLALNTLRSWHKRALEAREAS